MKKLLGVVILVIACAVIGPAQNTQATYYNQDMTEQHTILATQFGNATVGFKTQVGLNTHVFSYIVGQSVTSVTVTLQMQQTDGGYITVGVSTLGADSIKWNGTFTNGRVIYSNYAGSGSIDAEYVGNVQ